MALVLLTGGARSGKSRLAVELAARSGRAVVVAVTAEARDEEMAERIRRHREQRPADWTVVEAPIALEAAVVGAPRDAIVIVDCLTLWVANLIERGRNDDEIDSSAQTAATAAATRAAGVIAVTNEVGSGIVPDNPLARRFRDVLGGVNAVWARAADHVGLAAAGRLLPLVEPDEIWAKEPGWMTS